MKSSRFSVLISSICLFIIGSCSKNSDIPKDSTTATVKITFPDGRSYSYTDYSVKGGSQGYTYDGGGWGGNAPIDYLTHIPAQSGISEYFIYNFKGQVRPGGYFLTFGVPSSGGFSNYVEDFAQWPAVNAMASTAFNLQFKDTMFTAKKLTVSSTGISNGTFSLSFQLDSVLTGNNSTVAYPSRGVMTISGTFKNVNFIN